MTSHEPSVAEAFTALFKKEAAATNNKVASYALGGQDRDAGADYLYHDNMRFSIVEFKYNEGNILRESEKPRRLKLCHKLALPENKEMREMHDKCHFIAWKESWTMKRLINIYRNEVCNTSIFGDSCGLSDAEPYKGSRTKDGAFIRNFLQLTKDYTLDVHEFSSYMEWVLKCTSDSSTGDLILMTFDEDTEDFDLLKYSSIKDAYDAFIDKRNNYLSSIIQPPI
ncbi:hypothetical protein [Azospirillum baldaniorum]|nr:hypothetical protein [Azospirillum baldaniorum]